METVSAPLPRNGLATASLVLGILTIVPGCLLPILGIPFALAAITCGIIALVQLGKVPAAGKGLAIAGLVMGGVGLILVPFSTITSLMILGPIIGDTFSTINASLTSV